MSEEPKPELPKTYDPSTLEKRWYDEWLDKRYFHADAAAPKAPFSIVIPPPNVTGSLHMGHALGRGIEDIFTRWRRMAGVQRHVAARHRPRRHRHPAGGRARAPRKRREEPARHRPRGVRRAGLALARAVRRPDPRAAASDGLFARLGPNGLHHGPGLFAGGDRGLRAALRGGPDLPGQSAHQLVHLVSNRPVGPGGRLRRGDAGRAVRVRLSAAPTAPASWWWPRPVPRRCWATPRWPCTPTIPRHQAQDRQEGQTPVRRTGDTRSSPTACWSTPSSAPARSR